MLKASNGIKTENHSSNAREKYNQNSRFYDLVEFPAEFFLYRHWRRKLFRKIRGQKVLEVGVGTGKNLKYYGKNLWTVGVDLSEGMLSRARAFAKTKSISLVQMDAQNLAFHDNIFDTILATFVFCSVPDPIKGLREIRRVIKLDGQVLFIEHVLPKSPILRWIFNSLDPLTSSLSGVHINRKTADNIRKAGFKLMREENLFFSIFKFFSAIPVNRKEGNH